jgi:hypothetical protein
MNISKRALSNFATCPRDAGTLFAASLLLIAGCSSPPDEPLVPSQYASPLVQLQKLVGRSDHLHTDEVRYRASDAKLFHCSYTFGVIDARSPAQMAYLAENLRHTIPGDARRPGCIHHARDGAVVYTVHRGNIDNPAFAVEPRQLRVQPGQTATLSISYSASKAEKETALLHFSSNDPDSPARRGYLVANQPGLGVGKPLPETTVALVEGGQWSSSEAKGQVMLLAYFATF